MNNTIVGLELNLTLDTQEMDKTIGVETLKNLQDNIQELIEDYYNAIYNTFRISGELINK